MAKKLSVTTPWGTFSRRTERNYVRLVTVCGESEAYLQARHESERLARRKELAEYREVVAGRKMPLGSLTVEQYAGYVADLEAYLSAMPERHEAALAENRRTLAAGEGMAYGWSQSEANARKMAARAAEDGYVNVNVYEVNQ